MKLNRESHVLKTPRPRASGRRQLLVRGVEQRRGRTFALVQAVVAATVDDELRGPSFGKQISA